MADVKRILVVDDHFEMLELLRSMLALSGHDYEVLAVPSAEEGFLELQRTQFDLLITDVRLPGISGFDLIRRARRRYPNVPVIMITGYSSAQGQQEAADLGVYRYFAKPLDTDEVLTAVNRVLYGETAEPAAAPQGEPEVPFQLPAEARKRLDTLRTDTGAVGLVLASVGGQVLFEAGSRRQQLNIVELASVVARNMGNSFLLTNQLGGQEPFTIQYYTGDSIELYCANIGRAYFVTIFFDVESRRGRIGTIWVFAQRAIKDLLTMLPGTNQLPAINEPQPKVVKPASSVASTSKPEPVSPVSPPRRAVSATRIKADDSIPPQSESPEVPAENKNMPTSPPDIDGLIEALDLSTTNSQANLDAFWDSVLAQEMEGGTATTSSEPAERAEPGPADLLAALNLDEADTDVNLDAFWDEALAKGNPNSQGHTLSLDEARRQGILNIDSEQLPDLSAGSEVDLDNFWDEALSNEADAAPKAFSFEEAMRRGLISKLDTDS